MYDVSRSLSAIFLKKRLLSKSCKAAHELRFQEALDVSGSSGCLKSGIGTWP